MSSPYEIILHPIMTEKAARLLDEENQVVFKVKYESTKPQIKSAVEELFDVKVTSVNTCIQPTKPKRVGFHFGRTQAYKKAYVSLSEDDYLDFYALEGVGAEAGAV